jgi:hypothetical protein
VQYMAGFRVVLSSPSSSPDPTRTLAVRALHGCAETPVGSKLPNTEIKAKHARREKEKGRHRRSISRREQKSPGQELSDQGQPPSQQKKVLRRFVMPRSLSLGLSPFALTASLLVFAGLFAGESRGDTATVLAAHATYIDSSDTGANFGGRGYLYLKDDSQRDIWLRFRAVDFQPAIPAGSTWNSVTLKMRWDDAQTDQGALLNGAVNIRISSDDTRGLRVH